MKLISRDAGRLTLLFPLEEITPLNGINAVQLIEQLSEKYSFKRKPSLEASREEVSKNGLVFGVGEVFLPQITEDVTISEFSIFTDGIVVNSTTTDKAEAFVDDLIDWLRSDHQFRDFSSRPRKLYVSQLVVEFEQPLSRIIYGYELIANLISKNLNYTSLEISPHMDLARIDFEIDRTTNGNQSLPRFLIERRVGLPFANERYFCGAPMTTDGHIEVLEEIERILTTFS